MSAVAAEWESERADAVASYLEWARGVLESYPFSSRTRRRVWELHADGKTFREICDQELWGPCRLTAPSLRDVERIITEVAHAHLPPPVTNPWRRSGRKAPELAGVGNVRELLGGESMPAIVQYSRIRIRKGFEVRVPGIPLPKDTIVPGREEPYVEGRPHAGGIDVTFGANTVTVPWWKIEEAVRVGEV